MTSVQTSSQKRTLLWEMISSSAFLQRSSDSICRRKSGVWLDRPHCRCAGTNPFQNAVTLDVDLIEDVVWNTDAFKFLVIDDRMKELVQAVVTNQIHSAESTDLIRGKGSGLTMLLHG